MRQTAAAAAAAACVRSCQSPAGAGQSAPRNGPHPLSGPCAALASSVRQHSAHRLRAAPHRPRVGSSFASSHSIDWPTATSRVCLHYKDATWEVETIVHARHRRVGLTAAIDEMCSWRATDTFSAVRRTTAAVWTLDANERLETLQHHRRLRC